MEKELRKTGVDSIGDVPWGTHFCQFYNNKKDLIDILVPYFKAGLENNEFCLWVTSKPLAEKEAKKTIKRAVPDLDRYLKRGQIEIVPYTEWYLKDGVFNSQRVLNAWVEKLNQAIAKGYDGMRVSGNEAWLKKREWKSFADYEGEINTVIGKYRMVALCTYPLDKCGVHEVIDMIRNHQFALIRREGKWEFIESTERKQTEEMLQHQRDALSTHTRILSAILRTRDLDKLLNTILEEVIIILQVGFGSIHLVQGDDLVLRCWNGFSDTSRAHLLSFSAEKPPDWMRKLLFTKEQLSEHGIIPAFAKREGIQSWICIPLELPPLREGETNKWLGTLILCSHGINALDKERIETLEAISHKIALAIDRAQSYRDAQERLFRLQALRDVDKAIIKQIDLKEVIHIVLDRVPKELGADAAAVSFLDEKQKETKIFAMRLPNGTIIEEEVFTLAESLLHWFVDKQEPVIIYNLLQDPRVQMNRNHLRNTGIVSYLGVPLIVQNKTIGILHILTTRPMIFKDEDVEFFRTLAGQTAIALENARVTEELRESGKKYRTIFETTGTATTIVEEDTTISLANRGFERLSGYSKEEIEGKKSWKEFVVKEDLERMKKFHIQRRIEPNAAPKNYEFRFIDGQGNIKDILLNIDMIPGTKKSVASLLDITDRKEAEASLRESEEKYRSLFEDSKDVVYISTIEGKFLDINSAGVELFGYDSKEELLKVDIVKDLYLNPHDRKKFIQTMEQQGFVKDYELLLKRRDGEILTLLLTTLPYRDKEGKITEYRGIMRDVTHQRKLEQQLIQSQKMEAVGQLAGGVAHDFNNILQAILGYASVLQMKMKEDDPLRHNADQIIVSTERAANLTHGLLAFSRKQLISLKPVNLNEIIKKMEKLLTRIIGEDIEFQTVLADEELTVMADSSHIEQVLMNLATNARDAMPDGGRLIVKTGLIELDNDFINAHGYGKPGMYAVFSVTDIGIGMDDSIREKIFEPFFTTKEVGKGTGLGLSMAYGIIKQHEGYINVYSAPKKGTTFLIYLPLIEAEVKEAKPASIPLFVSGTETVLVAEDDATVRKLMKNILEEYGYKVIEAADGEDALNKFMENKDKIQLLLLDVIMPKKDGREVYEDAKRAKRSIKALFISGYAADILHKKGIMGEGLNFVLKPISSAELLKKIREVLDGSK